MMTHENKITYLRIAASLCNLGFKDDQLDLLVSLYEAVGEKKGKMTLSDAVEIEEKVKKRADARTRKSLLDKVSEKV